VTTPPRVPPLPPAERDEQAEQLLAMAGERAELNIFTTLVRNPRVFKRWVPFGHILLNGTLPARDRELLVLRVAHRSASAYEWSHHERIALDVGLDQAEIVAVREGPDRAGWSAFDAALLRAVDELLDDYRISDSTWEVLAGRYDDQLLIEVPMLVGHYTMLAQTLNSLGVPADGS
jgi:4-carboxymuconolactone decarboxylase